MLRQSYLRGIFHRSSFDNSLVLGSVNTVNGATANTNVGIGTTTPQHRLDVKGDMNLHGGNAYRIDGQAVLAHDALILKATDADAYFRITVDARGQLKATAL